MQDLREYELKAVMNAFRNGKAVRLDLIASELIKGNWMRWKQVLESVAIYQKIEEENI